MTMSENKIDKTYFRLYFPGDEHTPETQIDFRGETAVPFCIDFIHDRKPQPGVPRGTTPETNLQTLQDAWVDWSDKTFGGSPIIAGRKLMHESKELLDAVELEQNDNVKKELADVFMIVLDIAAKHNMTVADLIRESTNKFNRNKSRRWVEQPDGTFQHASENTVEYFNDFKPIAFDLCIKLKEHKIAQCSSHCFVSSSELKMDKSLIEKTTLESIGFDNVHVHCDAFTRQDICAMLHTDVNDDDGTVHELCHNAIYYSDILFEMNQYLENKYTIKES